jgi:hypothetical protein
MSEQRPAKRLTAAEVAEAFGRMRNRWIADCYQTDSLDALEAHIAALTEREGRLVEVVERLLAWLACAYGYHDQARLRGNLAEQVRAILAEVP